MSDQNQHDDQAIPEGYRFSPPEMDDFEIVVTDEPPEEEPEEELPEEYKSLKKADLVAKLQETQTTFQQQLEEMKQKQAAEQGAKTLAEQLAEALPGQQAQPTNQQPPPPPQLSQEEWNEKFAEDPYKAMNEFYATKLGPEVQRLMSNNVNISKEFINLDPSRASTYQKYAKEIDAEVAGMPMKDRVTNTNVYKEAHDKVVARHLDDVIAEKVNEALEARGEGAQAPQPQPQQPPRSPYDEPNVRKQPPAGAKPKQVYLSPEEKAFADRKGIEYKDLARMKSQGRWSLKGGR